MDPVIIGIIAVGLSGTGLVSVIVNAATHIFAQRKLVREMNRESEAQILRELESARSGLVGESPDPVTLGRAVALLTEVAQNLPENQRQDIIGTLNHGSEKSRANYCVKLIDQIEKVETN